MPVRVRPRAQDLIITTALILSPSSDNPALLEVRDLHLWRGERHVLRGLSFQLAAGQALQLTWANGTGKTSLLRALAGLLHVDTGLVLWRGRPIHENLREFHAEMAFCSHEAGLKPDLTVDENLRFLAGLHRYCDVKERRAALARMGLAKRDDDLARRLSAGQARRAGLARLSLQGARLWLLDEPAAHLDAQGLALVTQLVSEHVQAGGLALVATHQPLALAANLSAELELPSARAA